MTTKQVNVKYSLEFTPLEAFLVLVAELNGTPQEDSPNFCITTVKIRKTDIVRGELVKLKQKLSTDDKYADNLINGLRIDNSSRLISVLSNILARFPKDDNEVILILPITEVKEYNDKLFKMLQNTLLGTIAIKARM